MSKERIYEIRAYVNYDYFQGMSNNLREEDFEWLIEQAQLIESHAPVGRNYTNLQYVELLNENEELAVALNNARKEIIILNNKLNNKLNKG